MKEETESKKWKAMALRLAAIPEVQEALLATQSHDVKPDWESVEEAVLHLCDQLVDAKAEISRHHQDFERWEEMAAKGVERIEELKELREKVDVLDNSYVKWVEIDGGYVGKFSAGERVFAALKTGMLAQYNGRNILLTALPVIPSNSHGETNG